MYNIESKTEMNFFMPSTLISCFSKSGKTKRIADIISQTINAPVHEIITEKKYPNSYFMTILESRREFKNGERPVLTSEPVDNFSSYNRIIIGFPIWFFTCPMAVVSWLERYDFSGKEIYPFCTSGGSNCVKATQKIREICKGANVHEGIKTNTINEAVISEWLK